MKNTTSKPSIFSGNAHLNLRSKVIGLCHAMVIAFVCVYQIGCAPETANADRREGNQNTSGTSGGQTQVVHEDEWSRVYVVADAMATPHKRLNITSEKELVQLIRRKSAGLSLVSDVDPTLKPGLERIRRAYRTADLSFQELKELDEEQGKRIWGDVGALVDLREENQKPPEEQSSDPATRVAGAVIDWILYARKRAKLISELRQHEYVIRTTIANVFPRIRTAAEKLAVATSPCLLEASYYPAWHGAYGGDKLVVKNAGDKVIENGILLVDLVDDQGKHDLHLHTVDALGPGELLSLTYGYRSTDFYFSATRDNVRKINVSLVSLRHAGETQWSFTQSEHDARVKEYCKHLRFTGRYLPPKKAGFFTSSKDPGFSFKFSGLSRLPVNRVEITFQGDFGSVTADGEEQGYMTANKLVEKRSKGFPRQRPKQVCLKLGFRDSNYVHEITLPIK